MSKSLFQQSLNWCKLQEFPIIDKKPYRDMLLNWVEQAVDQAGGRAVAQLTPDLWPAGRIKVRHYLLESLGLDPLPTRTTTPARFIGRVDRDGYVIERLVLEPRPHFLMPIHLYLPTDVSFPAPAILYAPGHWMINSKTEPDIQAFCIGAAKLGFVVLVFDPIGQGERGASFLDHSRRDLLLSGLSQEGVMAWESMRAIDYLLTRPEVDGNRIGMTGASGGGLNTLYTCAADDRIAVSVSVCYVTSFARFFRAMRNLNWNNQNDLCNQVPNVIRDSEMAGLCGLIHPRPLLVINGLQDPQFPVDGAQEVIDQVREIYSQVDNKRLRLTAIDSDHGYNQEMRQAAYGWFAYWLQGNGSDEPLSEPAMKMELPDSEELKCFLGTSSIGSGPALRMLSRAYAKALQSTRLNDQPSYLLRHKLAECLGFTLQKIDEPTINGVHAKTIVDNTEIEYRNLSRGSDLITPAFILRRSERQSKQAVIYACDEGKLDGPGPCLLEPVLDSGGMVVFVDLRGIGETAPLPSNPLTLATLDGKIDEYLPPPGFTLEFEAATDSLMLGQSLLGQQVQDLLNTVSFVRNLEPGISIAVAGSGPRMALAALFTAALDESISACWVDRLLPSYNLLVEEDEQVFPITAYLFGILKVADIPQIIRLIGPRPLTITCPIGARLQPLDLIEARNLLQIQTEGVYVAQEASADLAAQFRIAF
jgi:hypothetical protein